MDSFFKTSIRVVCGLSLIVMFSCDNDNEGPIIPPTNSKGEKAVKEVIENLENNPEVSQFLEILKKIDVSNLEEEELTVFAVRNPAVQKTGKTYIRA